MMRSFLLACSQNRWLRERAPRYPFVRRAVSRFMPGETLEDALAAARSLSDSSIGTVFTLLGENITEPEEAARVTEHYLAAVRRIRELGLGTELSVKLTQLGLDLDKELCFTNLRRIIQEAGEKSTVWMDMEASNYVDATLEIYRRARQENANVGVCLQAYLYRTEKDLASLIPLGGGIRLVKGAYRSGRNQEGGLRIPDVVRNSAGRAKSPRACGLENDCAHCLRNILVSMVHATLGRTSRECLVRLEESHLEMKRNADTTLCPAGAYSTVAHASSCGTTDSGLPGGGRTAGHAMFAQARAQCRLGEWKKKN